MPPELPELDVARIGPAIGASFPDVRLPDQTGRMLDLHGFRNGRRLLFVVYRSAHW